MGTFWSLCYHIYVKLHRGCALMLQPVSPVRCRDVGPLSPGLSDEDNTSQHDSSHLVRRNQTYRRLSFIAVHQFPVSDSSAINAFPRSRILHFHTVIPATSRSDLRRLTAASFEHSSGTSRKWKREVAKDDRIPLFGCENRVFCLLGLV